MKILKKDEVYDKLKTVIDPELNVNIVELGLIYEVKISNEELLIKMTLTSPGCPLAPVIYSMIEESLEGLEGYSKDKLNLMVVFDPPWTVEMMSEEVRAELGLDE
jgi:metal-sulfur cluster biosynthetic enzyme